MNFYNYVYLKWSNYSSNHSVEAKLFLGTTYFMQVICTLDSTLAQALCRPILVSSELLLLQTSDFATSGLEFTSALGLNVNTILIS